VIVRKTCLILRAVFSIVIGTGSGSVATAMTVGVGGAHTNGAITHSNT